MKIALAAIRFKVMGGKERDCVAIARHLAARGHDLRLLTTTGAVPEIAVPVEHVPVRAFTNHGRAAAFARAVRARAGAFDAVLAFDKLPGAEFCYAADVCLAAQDVGLKRFLPRWRALVALERAVFAPPSRTQCFFLNARQAADYARVYGTPPERSVVLPLILQPDRRPPERFYAGREDTRARLRIPAQVPLAITLAATNPLRKGLDRTVAALAAVPELHLLVVGGVTGRRFLRQAARIGAQGRVHAVGYTRDVAPLLAAADLMIHPARVEAAGLALIESLLAGVPVVASAACGYAGEIERSAAGVVLREPFRQSELDEAVRQAIRQGVLMKARARAYAQNLPPETAWLDAVAERIEGGAASGSERD